MAIKLNSTAFDYAKSLIKDGKFVIDERDAWSEHQPLAEEENRFIEEHGFDEYAKWYLGIDDEQDEDNKGRYKFPYGNFERVHRCGLLAAESRAGQRKYFDIELAVAHLTRDARDGRHRGELLTCRSLASASSHTDRLASARRPRGVKAKWTSISPSESSSEA
jgi:hypothetical protein